MFILRVLPESVGIIGFLAVWYGVSVQIPGFLLPSPITTFFDTVETLTSSDFWANAALTFGRSLEGLIVAFVLANIAAILSAASRVAKKGLWPLILLGNSFPGTIATFIAVVVLGSRGPVAITVEVALLGPLLFYMLYPAYEAIDKNLYELAVVFRLSNVTYLRSIVLPQLAPALFAAIRTGLANGWKLVVTAEVFSLGDGVGYRILQYFNLFSLRHVFAWLLSFLLIMLAVEYLLVAPFERWVVARGRK